MISNTPPPTTPIRVMFGGSRSFSDRSLLSPVVLATLRAGCSISVGCAIGADALVASRVVASDAADQLHVFAMFGPAGSGFWSGSAVGGVQAATAAGARVSWLAGGPLSIPLRARLVLRSKAALVGCGAAVFFLSSPQSPGSLAVAALAVAAGLPVFVFRSGSWLPAAPRGCAGSWLPGQFFGLPCLVWVPQARQPALS